MKTNESDKIINITQIQIKLKDREISLSSEEARKVYEELDKLFEMEQSETVKQYEKIVPMPYPVPSYPPIIIERTPYWPRPWETTCCSKTTHFGDPPGTCSAGGLTSNRQILSINLS